ncbi:MAG: type II secretion system major pseudopilin GspG [Gemmatimonadota bacterium]
MHCGWHLAPRVHTRLPECVPPLHVVERGTGGEARRPRKASSRSVVSLPPCPPAPPPDRRSGFTLIEILVVITVIAILAGLVTPMVFRNVGDAKATAAKAQIELLGLALDTYRLHNDRYPSTAQGLAALIVKPLGDPVPRDWRGPYLRQALPDDPWGKPYHYESPGTVNPDGYDLISYGRDGQPGGTGEDADVNSWSGRAPASGTTTR